MTKRTSREGGRQRKMRRAAPLWVLAFLLLGTPSTAQPAGEHLDSSTTPTLAPACEPLTQYRAFRRMHAVSDRFNQEAWLDAWTERDHRGFRYEIVSERGSEYVRNKVLRALLQREQELVADGQAGRADLTEDNYAFTATQPRDGLRYVLMKPKRKEVVLVDGLMVLTPDGSDVLRIEGRLAKNPSFWTSLVNIVRHFAKIDGVRVPVATESVARVRFAGQSRLSDSYDYVSINGRPVSVTARQMVASTVAASGAAR